MQDIENAVGEDAAFGRATRHDRSSPGAQNLFSNGSDAWRYFTPCPNADRLSERLRQGVWRGRRSTPCGSDSGRSRSRTCARTGVDSCLRMPLTTRFSQTLSNWICASSQRSSHSRIGQPGLHGVVREQPLVDVQVGRVQRLAALARTGHQHADLGEGAAWPRRPPCSIARFM